MAPLYAVLGITAMFIVLAVVIAKVDGLAFLAPKSTRALRTSAHAFCTTACRKGGACPLTASTERAEDCPLWRYVGSDVATTVYGNPFEPVRT